jgi:hypothetical protein
MSLEDRLDLRLTGLPVGVSQSQSGAVWTWAGDGGSLMARWAGRTLDRKRSVRSAVRALLGHGPKGVSVRRKVDPSRRVLGFGSNRIEQVT